MPCDPLTSLAGCLGPAGGQAAVPGAGGGSEWAAICQSFASAAQQLLGSFAKSFTAIPPVSLSYSGVRSVYGLSLEIAAVIAALLLMTQVIRMLLAHDGSAIAQGLTGIGKAALAFALTLGAATTALRASDELTSWIITRTFGSPQALTGRLARLASFSPKVPPSLLLILALLGILLTLALWAQLLIRNVAVTVLVAVSPIAAAGQVAHASRQWWRKLARATIQLIALKPVVALVLAAGLTMPATTTDTTGQLLAGMLILLLAASAWPAMARAAAVLEVHLSGGTAAATRGTSTARTGPPGGINPAELSRIAEARTMTAIHELRARPRETRREPPARRQPGPVRPSIGAGGPAAGQARDLISSRAIDGGARALPGAQAGDRAGTPAGVSRTAPSADGAPSPPPDTDVADNGTRPLLGLEPGNGAATGSWRNR